VSAFNHETLNALVDTLGQLPPNINKIPALRDKPIPEILAMGLTPQSAVTVKKKWTRLIAFGAWLKGRGLVDENYANGKKPKALNKSYEKFSEDDLKRLFEGEEFSNGSFSEPFQYWLPVLALYTGARLRSSRNYILLTSRKILKLAIGRLASRPWSTRKPARPPKND